MFEKWIDKGGIGTAGPDGGVVVADEELPNVGRVTLEEKTGVVLTHEELRSADRVALGREKAQRGELTKYYAVTEGLYGWLVHTAYFHDLDDAQSHVYATKLLMQAVEGRG